MLASLLHDIGHYPFAHVLEHDCCWLFCVTQQPLKQLMHARHRHREFLRFLKTIDQRTLPNLDLHLIVDNYAPHKTPAVKRWLKRHARFRLHFTPRSGSWLNMVERFFAEITRKRIRRGVFKSVDELKQAIMDYLDNHNGHPKPYIWTKTATEILSKVARAKQVLDLRL